MHISIAVALLTAICGWSIALGAASDAAGEGDTSYALELQRTSGQWSRADLRGFQSHSASSAAFAQASQTDGTTKEEDLPPIRIKRGQKRDPSSTRPEGQTQIKRGRQHSHKNGHAHTHSDKAGHRHEHGHENGHGHSDGLHDHADHAPGQHGHAHPESGDHEHGDHGHDHHHGIYDRKWDVVSSG